MLEYEQLSHKDSRGKRRPEEAKLLLEMQDRKDDPVNDETSKFWEGFTNPLSALETIAITKK